MDTSFEWEKGFDKNYLLSKINSFRTVRDGRCAFNSAEYAFWLPVLNSAIRASAIGASLKSQCIVKALSDPSFKLNDPNNFLERCNEAFAVISKGKALSYVVLFHVTYSGPKLFNSIVDGPTRICWQPRTGNKFYSKAYAAQKKVFDLANARGVPTSNDGMTALLVHVIAYNVHHAHEEAINAVDRLRGLINLIVNSNRSVNPFSRFAKPHAINKFRLGPYRTVHNPDGSLAAEVLWYEPRWAHEEETVKFSGAPEKTRKDILKWWNMARINPLSDAISDGLLRYCRALDQHDPDAAILGLWGAIEILTGTQNENYNVTVDRIVQLFKDRTDTRQIAQHIRLRRNSTVHAAKSPDADEVDSIILQAELLTSQIIFFYIKSGKNFRNSQELLEFLKLPADQVVLARKKQIISYFMKYQNR